MPEYRVVPCRGKFALEWYDDKGKRQRRSLGTSDRSQIESEVQRVVREVELAQRPKAATVEQIWMGYIDSISHKPAAVIAGFQWRTMGKHLGHLRAGELTEDDVAKYVQVRKAQGRTDGTLGNELRRLRSALRWGERKGLIPRTPYFPLPPQSPPRDLRLTRVQAEAFLSACIKPHVKLFVTLALATAARMGALLDLKWEQVDLDASRIDLQPRGRPSTNKGRSVVPINSWARTALLEAFKQRPLNAEGNPASEYVITYAGQRIINIKQALINSGERCGLPWVTAHVFRHSVASWMAEDRVPMAEIARYLGHRNSRITEEVYAKFSPDYLRDAARSATPIRDSASWQTVADEGSRVATEGDQMENTKIVNLKDYQGFG